MNTGEQVVSPDGRPLGRRAQETRRRLLDATQELLESGGARDLRVVEIARQVGASPATFYQYFRDVEEALLELADEAGQAVAGLAVSIRESWEGPAALENARRLVDGFIAYWDRYRAILGTRNLHAQEGDERFRDVRNRALGLITDPLAEKVAALGAAPGITPYAAAAAIVAMMERMAAYHINLEERGVRRDEMVETVARIVVMTVTNRCPD
jgi:AcrR family transcriptional regulator